ncbi:SRPBCC family protein [Nonomuraea sp. SMC257]|uniref:SRPBCC family protein n=1 Tax=Nonomuraea montanisoli TaxID=2741721 RepID=A0A7Y6I5C1_9ACTN|nr:SRPBCC family protein [Nonomuraea montanisoli]NUW31871.1 SRPBCC family protein [Nonomuraea montanisoli]
MPRLAADRAPDVSLSVEVAAPAEVVYELVSDVPRLPSWAAECVSCRWMGGATGPAPGARFLGVNRNGFFRWFTVSEVRDAEPGRLFAWEVVPGLARWEYRITPTGAGCTVTESTWDGRGFVISHVIGPVLTGVHDRRAANARNIARTLDRLKAAAEAAAVERRP